MRRADGATITIMSTPLRILLIAAKTDDSLPLRLMRDHGFAYTVQRASGLNELRATLRARSWDVALLDEALSPLDVEAALVALRERGSDLPLIVITDNVSDAAAVAALRAGARDVVHRSQPGRLALTIERAALEARERRERRRVEIEFFRQAALAEALARVAGRLNTHLDRGAVINAICEETVRALDADMACVALPAEGSTQEIVGCAGHSQPLVTQALAAAERFLAGDHSGADAQTWTILDTRLLRGGRPLGTLLAVFGDPARPIGADERTLLSGLADQASIALDNAALLADLQASNEALARAYDATLEGWVHALDLRDKETEGHTRRVTAMTTRLAAAMGFDAASLAHIRRGALLHDIGKLAIPDRILHKPGPLDDAEWDLMRLHPVYAYEWLAPISFLAPALDIPYCHHERWDGGGYPRGLRAHEIPLAARIFALVDTWDALRSERPYKPAYSEIQSLQIITTEASRQFDPAVVTTFLRLLPELRARV